VREINVKRKEEVEEGIEAYLKRGGVPEPCCFPNTRMKEREREKERGIRVLG